MQENKVNSKKMKKVKEKTNKKTFKESRIVSVRYVQFCIKPNAYFHTLCWNNFKKSHSLLVNATPLHTHLQGLIFSDLLLVVFHKDAFLAVWEWNKPQPPEQVDVTVSSD